ncbi:MAG: Cys-tRNA(Pro) deacylase [Clostridiales bacterium]|nr:Cys-tRNA(Pro) deacylase [Clostridiales bacterium]
MAEFKTNVYRIFDKEKLPYTPHTYEHGDGPVDGATISALLGIPASHVFKTLVTQGNDRNFYVFDVPVDRELDLKKAAKAVGVKSVEMIHVADINKVTGYVRGGCSPVGMKKKYKTVFDISAKELETMLVSAGRIGWQIEAKPDDLAKISGATFADIVM